MNAEQFFLFGQARCEACQIGIVGAQRIRDGSEPFRTLRVSCGLAMVLETDILDQRDGTWLFAHGSQAISGPAARRAGVFRRRVVGSLRISFSGLRQGNSIHADCRQGNVGFAGDDEGGRDGSALGDSGPMRTVRSGESSLIVFLRWVFLLMKEVS